MFQCMTQSEKIDIDLRALYGNIKESSDTTFVRARAYAPGSLGQDVKPGNGWVIGSLSIRMRLMTTTNEYNEYSLFIFKNGKIKISGGSTRYYASKSDHATYEAWLESDVITSIYANDVLHAFLGSCAQWQLCLLNGIYKLGSTHTINPLAYRRMCEELMHLVPSNDFVSITPPICFVLDGHVRTRKGRICSVGLKYSNGGSARFDHGGSVQLMGFKSSETLNNSIQPLLNLLRAAHVVIVGRP